MKGRKLTAVLLSVVMVVAYSLPALADGVNGAGVVEYDDSTAVVYDSVTVPTLTGSAYDFTIDPTGLLHTFDADNYVAGSVYFDSVSTHASLVPKTGATLYTESKAEVAAVSDKWADIVKTASTDDETGAITVSALNEGFFVWAPKATASSYVTNGKDGEYVELDATNYSKWFKVVDESGYKLELRNDYRAGADICDGKIYATTYTAIPASGIVEAVGSAVSVDDYATISGGKVTAYTNVYERSGASEPYTYTLLDKDSENMVYTAEKSTFNGSTNSVDVTNKSTNDKVVKAEIVMSNVSGLTFKETDAYETDEADTSVYFAATDGTTPVAFVASEDGETATATFSVALPKKTGGDDITYQTEAFNAAGGHVYARYEGPNASYTTKAFYITASANTDPEAVEAWNTWAKGITASTRPSVNIIYSVSNNMAGKTVTFNANYGETPATATATTGADGKVTAPSTITRADYTLEGWYEDEECTPAKKVDLATKTFSADTTLYANWTQDSYDVTFDLNYDGAADPEVVAVAAGAHPEAPADPERSGYTFKFWGEANDATSAIDLASVSAATTVYAIWEEAAPTELEGSYDSTAKIYSVTLAAAVSDVTDITNVKINDNDLTSGITTNASGTKVKFAKDDVKAAIGDTDWATTNELVFTFTVDGTNYICTIAR